MAKKSKTQKAKASAARAAKKAEREQEPIEAVASEEPEAEKAEEGAKKRGLLKKESAEGDKPEKSKATSKGSDIKKAEKPKKKRFQFLREVRGELKRVTWPTKKDVGQWTAVVVAALIFFGAYVAILDNLVITPALIGVSSIEVPEAAEPETQGADESTDAALDASAGAEGAGDEAASAEGAEGAADAGDQESLSEEQGEVEAPAESDESASSQEG